MSADGWREGKRRRYANQRQAGTNPRALGTNPRAIRPTAPAPAARTEYDAPLYRTWPAAFTACRRCRLPVLLAVTRRGRLMAVDPFPRAGGRVTLSAEPSHKDPSKPLATVLGHEPAGVTAYAHHGATCAVYRPHRPADPML